VQKSYLTKNIRSDFKFHKIRYQQGYMRDLLKMISKERPGLNMIALWMFQRRRTKRQKVNNDYINKRAREKSLALLVLTINLLPLHHNNSDLNQDR
jgi:hypothetical protein